jgi:hypothetical protein
VVFGLLLQEICHSSGTVFFSIIFVSFSWLCASVLLLGHCVVAEAGCNFYLRDTKIFPLLKKGEKRRRVDLSRVGERRGRRRNCIISTS